MVVLLLPKNDQFLGVGFVPNQPALNGRDSLFGMDPLVLFSPPLARDRKNFHGLAISMFARACAAAASFCPYRS
jgi:hypothetical protein